MPHPNLGRMILDRAATSASAAAFRVRQGDTYVDVRWSEVAPRIDAIAAGLLAGPPLDDGACVTILGSTSLDWVVVDLAALRVGLRTVPIYASLLPEEVGYMHADTQARRIIAENAAQLAKVRAMRGGFTFFGKRYDADQIVAVGPVVVLDPTGLEPADDWEPLSALEARGREQLAALQGEMARRLDAPKRSDVATYTYTSGTTGPPKAVIQTHDNMLAMLETVADTRVFDEQAQAHGIFLFLPLAHSFGRLAELAGPFFGAPLVLSTVPTLAADLGLSHPGFFPAAPRVFEKMKAKIDAGILASPPTRRRIAEWAIGVGAQMSTYTRRGAAAPWHLRLRHQLADRVVLSALRARLGLDRASVLLSGSAPLRADVHEFFLALGLTLLEAYGLTETCPGLTANRPGNIRVGTVGQAFSAVTLRVADDGEVLAKGPNITSGYLHRPDATAEAFDADGWFHTGDLGSLDGDGFLRITGRKKELLKTSGGKYIAPVKIESGLKAAPFAQEAMVVGDGRNYCTAIFALDPELLGEFAKREGIPADPAHARVQEVLAATVAKVNVDLASYEQIKRFCVAPGPFTVDGGELTASLKVKRRVVTEKYAALIEGMYAG